LPSRERFSSDREFFVVQFFQCPRARARAIAFGGVAAANDGADRQVDRDVGPTAGRLKPLERVRRAKLDGDFGRRRLAAQTARLFAGFTKRIPNMGRHQRDADTGDVPFWELTTQFETL
jgi:hypothetical protein